MRCIAARCGWAPPPRRPSRSSWRPRTSTWAGAIRSRPRKCSTDSGLHDLTLAFILSKGACNPEWDGRRPLLGGVDQAAIEPIRAAGGEVDVSFGGWSGKKLGNSCKSATALAAAYEKVIDAYSLRAIDIDIEHNELRSAKVRQRVMAALALVRADEPGLEISITFPSRERARKPTASA